MKPEQVGTQMLAPIKALLDSQSKMGPAQWKITTGALYHFLKKMSEKKRLETIREALAWAESESRREDEGEAAAGRAKEGGRDASREENHEGKRHRKIGVKN